MSRSFKGFLQAYAQELTGCGTSSIKKLFEAVVGDSPRGAEALLLLALASGRADYLMRQADGTSFEAAYRTALADLDRAGGILEKWLEQLPDQNRYRKVWNAWRSEATRLERDRRMLPGVRDAIDRVMAERGMTRAQACRLTGLNKGNFYAFMKGDVAKLSRETAVNAYRTLANG
ncbi:helix-turn-helix domain-containing protein [Adlercreutzia mucosicola]|uniref:helix-turn-helix domain-containing protein n=1 Tax=Adlercreutzia mucosicola TaxID=580026 RepID=UPI00047F3136|nr:helix-turn-helix transcriptional regulator [Adlercreutzia mucosicola]MCR2035260.1 XRE family transcriptional regulator [Adlercreutzia mucosicola]